MRIRRTSAAVTLAGAIAVAGSVAVNPAPGAAGESATDSASISPELSQALRQTGAQQVVVTFDGEGAPERADVTALRDAGVETGITLRSLPIAGVLASDAEVETLADDPRVRSLYLNERLRYDNDDYTELTGVDAVRRDRALTRANGGLPVTGDGVGVVVNDSGIDGTHQDLEYPEHTVQNVEAAANLNSFEPSLLPITYVEDVPNTDSTGGHGTHVAGIVGATGEKSGGKYEGVAPGADLVGYGSGAGLLLLDVLGGFDYALTHQRQYDIRVVTNSWGDSGDTCTKVDPDDPINVATKDAYDRNIVVVFSAGNSGPDKCTITGNYKKAPWVIAVAAGNRNEKLAEFSSRGTAGGGGSFRVDGQRWTWKDQPTLTAPGVNVVSTRTASPVGVIGAEEDLKRIDPADLPYYTTLSGTSMAAPHVAGAVALMLETNPELRPGQVKRILAGTTTDMPGYAAWQTGTGYVDVHAAVKRAASLR
ncbi:MAG: SprB [uncultured Nocardioidaceae bacterium]|uniref:SprB n=1 Tax=uncultured Nocardioidaceae bacterium TaxID=253824 RepID=A0A6J4MEH3_9ACTN|nr:MAG: SprB [uncultured Nocardioidaceae bacterium]